MYRNKINTKNVKEFDIMCVSSVSAVLVFIELS